MPLHDTLHNKRHFFNNFCIAYIYFVVCYVVFKKNKEGFVNKIFQGGWIRGGGLGGIYYVLAVLFFQRVTFDN